MQLADLHVLAGIIRHTAAQELLPRFARVQHEIKSDGSMITAADLAVQHSLQQQLSRHWPGTAMLGEEMTVAEQQRLLTETTTGLWIVDPLDGTMNFRNGVPFYAVSVALLMHHEIIMGVVYDPSRDESFTALRGHGAWLNEQPLNLSQQDHPEKMLVGIADFKRLPATLAQRLASQPPYQSQRSFGSVALDWCWLAAGRAQVYVHGKQNMWDYAAGSLVFSEAGGYACTLQGEPVFTGQLAKRSAVLAVNQAHFRQWCKYLAVPHISQS